MNRRTKRFIKGCIFGFLLGFGSARAASTGNVLWLVFILPFIFFIRIEIKQYLKYRKDVKEFKNKQEAY